MEKYITKTQLLKYKDLSKYYVKLIKSKKDIEKYINNSKMIEILQCDTLGLVGNVYNEKYLEEVKKDNRLPLTCKCLMIKILDMKEFQGCDHIITIYYNNIEDLNNSDNFYGKSDFKQEIYKILY